MPCHTSFGLSRIGTALIVFLLAASTPLFAASRTWTGLGGDGKWTTAANWSWNVSPVPGDYLVFPGSSGENDFPALTTFEGIFFTCVSCGARGNSITLGPGGIRISLHAIYLTPTFVDLDIALGNDSTLGYANSHLGFRGAISGAHNLSMSGSGQGSIILFGANTYSGTTLVNAEVDLVNDRALGASDGTPATGTIVTEGSLAFLDALTIGNEALTLNEHAMLRCPWESSWAGPITLNATSTINVDGKLTLSGPIAGSGGMTKTGIGLLRLTAANAYAGPTVINAGTLSVENSQPSSAISVNAGGTLTGSSAGDMGPVAVIGGTINPGVVPGGAASITVNGALALNAAAAFVIDLNSPTSFDRVVANGTVDLGGSTLTIYDNFGSAIGDSFNIVVNNGTDAVVGMFTGLPEGALFSVGGSVFRISYVAGTDNDVTLARVAAVTPTPVPATLVPMLDGRGMLIFGLMIAGAGFLLLIRWR